MWVLNHLRRSSLRIEGPTRLGPPLIHFASSKEDCDLDLENSSSAAKFNNKLQCMYFKRKKKTFAMIHHVCGHKIKVIVCIFSCMYDFIYFLKIVKKIYIYIKYTLICAFKVLINKIQQRKTKTCSVCLLSKA